MVASPAEGLERMPMGTTRPTIPAVGVVASPAEGLERTQLFPIHNPSVVGMVASPAEGLEQTMIEVAGAMTLRSEWRQARMRD